MQRVKTEAYHQEFSPGAQASTNAFAVVAGTQIDLAWARTLAFTITVAANSVDWKVCGANAADFSDEVDVNSATVAAAAKGNYTVSPVPYRYYRVKIKSTVADTPGNATVFGIAKG